MARRVTAVVPTWNGAAFIGKTLACLDAQTWPDLEILIGDDASTDATPEVLADYAATRPHVRVIRREANLGWIGNTNDLMERATGEYVFYMPHDDLIEPTYVARLAAALDADPGAVIAFCDMKFTDGDSTKVLVFDRMSGVRGLFHRAILFAIRPRNWWVAHRGLFRREAIDAIGGLKENVAGQFSADFPWLMHMALIGGFVRVPETLYHKVWLKTGVSRHWAKGDNPGGALHRAAIHEVRISRLPPVRKVALLALFWALAPLRWLRWKTLDAWRALSA